MNLFFIPRHEPNCYVSRTVRYDPMGQEFHVVQQTHEVAENPRRGNHGTPKAP